MPWTESSTALSTNKLVAINAQDALHITGFEPFLTLNDANANNAQARLQNAGGNFVFYTRSGLSAGSPTVVFNTLDQPAGTPVPSAIEIHAQEGVQIVGFQPFLTLADANAGFAKASLQNAGGNFNFYTRSGLSAGSPTVVFNTLDQPAGTPVPSAIEIHAQDGVEVVGFEPFITLADANAGFAKARIQNANGDIVFYAQGGITTAIPAMIIESATGNVHVTGTITADKDIILAGADCAERFDVAGEDHLEAGTVVVIDREGTLRESSSAYDKRVAGVVAGAGDYRPAIVMGSRGSDRDGTLVALVGKTYCKADASCGSIDVGDLLTASSTPGHAMKASDPNRAFGAVIGKALRPLHAGTGLIPILVALQ
jgi:hypothetical protein